MNENTSLSVVSVTVRGSENIGLKDICYIDGKCPEQFGNTNSVIYADKYGPGFVFAFFEMSVAGSYAPELRSLIGMRMRMLHRSTDFAHSTGEGILNDINATISKEIEKYCEYEKLLPGTISIYSKCIVVITGAKAYIERSGDCGTYFFSTAERRILSKNREIMDLHKNDCYMICSSAVKKSMSPADMQRCLDSNKSAENNVSVVLGAASANDKIHDLTAITIKILNANVANTSNTGFYQAVGAHSSSQKGAVTRVADTIVAGGAVSAAESIAESAGDTPPVQPVSADEPDDDVKIFGAPVTKAPEEPKAESLPEVRTERTTIDASAVSAAASAALASMVADAENDVAENDQTDSAEEPAASSPEETVTTPDSSAEGDFVSLDDISRTDAKPQSSAFGDHNRFVFDFEDDKSPTEPYGAAQRSAESEEPVVKGDTIRVGSKLKAQVSDAPEPRETYADSNDEDDKATNKDKIVTIVLGVLAALAFIVCIVVIAVKINAARNKQPRSTATPPASMTTEVPSQTELPEAVPTINLEVSTPVPTEEPTPNPTEAPTEEPTPALTYRMHTVASDETTFWSLAVHTLGDGSRWQEIAALNGMENQALTPGMELKIPLE